MADTKSPSGFIWYELMTSDLDEATRFYEDVVGWSVQDSGIPGMPYRLFSKGETAVGGMMSWASLGMNKRTQWKGHLFAADVDKVSAELVADGAKVFGPTQQVGGVGRFAVMADPQGAEFLLFEPDRLQVPPQLAATQAGGIGWRELATSNWEEAWSFYSKHFGWTKDIAVPMGAMGTYQTFATTNGSMGGMMNLLPQGNQAAPAWLFYFTVDEIQPAAERIRQSGGTVTHGPVQVPGDGWIVQATDSQGGLFALTAGQ